MADKRHRARKETDRRILRAEGNGEQERCQTRLARIQKSLLHIVNHSVELKSMNMLVILSLLLENEFGHLSYNQTSYYHNKYLQPHNSTSDINLVPDHMAVVQMMWLQFPFPVELHTIQSNLLCYQKDWFVFRLLQNIVLLGLSQPQDKYQLVFLRYDRLLYYLEL